MSDVPNHSVSCRRIDRLRQLAYDCNLTNDEARKFGKLTKTSTWEALLQAHGIFSQGVDDALDKTLDTALDETLDSCSQSLDTMNWTNDGTFPVCNFTPQNSTNFLEWVDVGQLIALVLASAGVFVLAMSMWRQINPLNLLPPIKINIQIGTKL